MVTAWSARRCPAGVSRTRRPAGSVSGVPASRASTASCGLLLLHQQPGAWSLVGVAFVVAAGIGAERTGARPAGQEPAGQRPAGQEPELTRAS
jgi:hypothetical protein